MSTKERKAKEKEELKSLILSSAMKLFIEKGVEQTTIRNIADAIDYSVGTVYVYFKDKNAILNDLHTQGFSQLRSSFSVLYNVADPLERLKAMGRFYLAFAMENKEMYDLMFSLKAPMEFLDAKDCDEWDEGRETFNGLKVTVMQCIASGHFKGHTPEPLSFLIWGAVHGMCSLVISQRTRGVQFEKPDTILEDAYAEFLMMIDKL